MKCNLPGEKWVIGDGPKKMAFEILYPDAKFFGYKTGKELVDLLSSADALVLPSRTETFGLVVLEAFACGLPVAAYPAPGPSYLIQDGVDGTLDENLEKAALRCLDIDRTKCREKALSYDWEHSMKAFCEYLVPSRGE